MFFHPLLLLSSFRPLEVSRSFERKIDVAANERSNNVCSYTQPLNVLHLEYWDPRAFHPEKLWIPRCRESKWHVRGTKSGTFEYADPVISERALQVDWFRRKNQVHLLARIGKSRPSANQVRTMCGTIWIVLVFQVRTKCDFLTSKCENPTKCALRQS